MGDGAKEDCRVRNRDNCRGRDRARQNAVLVGDYRDCGRGLSVKDWERRRSIWMTRS